MNISKLIHDFFKNEVDLSGAGAMTSSLISEIVTIPASSSSYTIESGKNYKWSPESLNASISVGLSTGIYRHSNLLVTVPENGSISFANNINLIRRYNFRNRQ